MAVTATLVSRTPQSQRYLLSQDGELPGDTAIVTAAQLLANTKAGALREMPGIGSDVAALDQAKARALMLADRSGVTDMTEFMHAKCAITQRSGSGSWTVDADTDAVNPLRCELNVGSQPGSGGSSVYLDVVFQGTLER